jgi:hypothetical protein
MSQPGRRPCRGLPGQEHHVAWLRKVLLHRPANSSARVDMTRAGRDFPRTPLRGAGLSYRPAATAATPDRRTVGISGNGRAAGSSAASPTPMCRRAPHIAGACGRLRLRARSRRFVRILASRCGCAPVCAGPGSRKSLLCRVLASLSCAPTCFLRSAFSVFSCQTASGARARCLGCTRRTPTHALGARRQRRSTLTPAGAVCARKACAWRVGRRRKARPGQETSFFAFLSEIVIRRAEVRAQNARFAGPGHRTRSMGACPAGGAIDGRRYRGLES